MSAPPTSAVASNPIDTLRISPYWSTVGATVDTTRPRCTTGTGTSVIAAYDGTAAAISTAIAGCDAGHAVELGAGTFNLTTGIVMEKSNVTLRGAGPNSTFVKFTGSCNTVGQAGCICINPASGIVNYNDSPHNACNWTAGYTRGTTEITLTADSGANCTVGGFANLAVDDPIFLDMLSDSTAANDGWWVSGGDDANDGVDGNGYNQSKWGGVVCQDSGCSRGQTRYDRPQIFYTKVTGVSGSNPTRTVTLADPLVHTNWNGSKTPMAWFPSSIGAWPVMEGFGIENISLDFTNSGPITGGILAYTTYGGWVKNVRALTVSGPLQSSMQFTNSARISVLDNYIYGKGGSTGNYGIAPYGMSNMLVQNNIGECNATTITDNTSSSVFGYNYFLNNCYVNPNWMQPGHSFHSVANSYVLLEGNDSASIQLDQIHGPAYFMTGFRNRWHGWEHGKSTMTVPVLNMAWSRYQNMVGNVLGTATWHSRYESDPSGAATDCVKSIFAMGWGDNCGPGGTGVNPPDDTRVKETMFRWGNYDTYNGTNRFESSEVPSADSYYPNTVPVSQALPNSLYLSAKPSWFGSNQWPPIGPDVTGGTESGVGGRVYDIPAKTCHASLAIDTNYAQTLTITNLTRASDINTVYRATVTTNRTLRATFSGTPTTTSGTVSDATGWAIGQKVQIGMTTAPHNDLDQHVHNREITDVSGSVITWSPALPEAPLSGEEAYFMSEGDSVHITGMTPTAYNGTYLVYSVSGNQFTYGLLTDPGPQSVLGTAYSPSVRQFTGCSYQP